MSSTRVMVAAASLALAAFATTQVAHAACTRLAFSVNDYGKDGPTKDAKNLLDKYIAKWTAKRGIKRYRTGPKSVTCELFLDLIVFDEYTCKASASVCWDGALPKGHSAEVVPEKQSKSVTRKPTTVARKKNATAEATETKSSPVVTGTISEPPKVAKKPPVSAAPAATAPSAPAVVKPLTTAN